MDIKDITKEAAVISEEGTFYDAVAAMVAKKSNTLLVTDVEGKLSGEVSVADLLNAIVPDHLDGESVMEHFTTPEAFENAVRASEDLQVSMFMSNDIDAVHVDDGLMTIVANAIAHERLHIAVLDHENRPIGIISRRELKHITADVLGIRD